MRKRRTRKDKIIAQLRREVKKTDITVNSETDNFSYPEPAKITGRAKVKEKQPETEEDYSSLFTYNPKLIQKDLLKTSLISILFFAAEFGLFFIIS